MSQKQIPLAVKQFLQSCFNYIDHESSSWIPPQWMNDLERLVENIKESFENKQQLFDYYELGVLLDYLCDTFESEDDFKTYFDAKIEFSWGSCKNYQKFAEFIDLYPRFQFTTFTFSNWCLLNTEIQKWFACDACTRLDSTNHLSGKFWEDTESDNDSNSDESNTTLFDVSEIVDIMTNLDIVDRIT